MTAVVLNGHGYKARRGSPTPVNSKTAGHRDQAVLSSKSSESDVNLKSVKKVDGHVASLLMTVPQVTIYKYLEDAINWERTLIEGTLFIYSRSLPPSHGFVLLNRLSSDNLHQLISPNIPIHTQLPFVLFKQNNGEIYGLCFNDETTCVEVGQLLSSLSLLDTSAVSVPTRASSAPSSSPSSSTGIPHQKSLDSLSERDHLTPSPSSDTALNGRTTTSSPQVRKDQARKIRSSSSRRSSEPVVDKKTNSSSLSSSAKSSRTRSKQRVSPQPGQIPTNSYNQKPVIIEKNKSSYSPAQPPVTSDNITASPTLARKLFPDSALTDQTNNKTAISAVPALRDLFAQAASKPSVDPVIPDAARPVLKKAVSLAEVEKQIMEVPSPTNSQPQKSLSCDLNSSLRSASEHPHVLLQPAVFSTSTTAPLSSEPVPGAVRPTVQMTVQPPTPVGPPPSNSLTAEPRVSAIFPTVPPQVHSPGMRAPPLSSTKHTTAARSSPIARQRHTVVEQTDSANLSAKHSPVLTKRVMQDSSSETKPLVNGHQSPQLVNNQTSDPPHSSASSLMSPGMFQQRSSTDPLPSSSPSVHPPTQNRSNSPVMVAGLTRHRLQQALLYLIQTDDKFVDTLHVAYVDSLRVNRSS